MSCIWQRRWLWMSLDAARAEGLPITVETCPHYLHFAAEEIGAFGDVEEVRSADSLEREIREGLWKGLERGTIDLIATDHSPCPPEMKRMEEGDFGKAWGGVASLSIAASVVWTGMRERRLPLNKLTKWMSQAPATAGWIGSSQRRDCAGNGCGLCGLRSGGELST